MTEQAVQLPLPGFETAERLRNRTDGARNERCPFGDQEKQHPISPRNEAKENTVDKAGTGIR